MTYTVWQYEVTTDDWDIIKYYKTEKGAKKFVVEAAEMANRSVNEFKITTLIEEVATPVP